MSKEIPSIADLRAEGKSRIAGDIQLLGKLDARVERLDHILQQRLTLESDLFGVVNLNDVKRAVKVGGKIKRSVERMRERRQEAKERLSRIREHVGLHTVKDLYEAREIIGMNRRDFDDLWDRTGLKVIFT